jgi:hypothetical protein
MRAPYYGAYFATAAMAGAASAVPISDGRGSSGGYAMYSASGKLIRVALFNSEFFGGGGVRPNKDITLIGLEGNEARIRRLTAAGAMSTADGSGSPTFSGQTFSHGDCKRSGEEKVETVIVESGRATMTLRASEAALLDI